MNTTTMRLCYAACSLLFTSAHAADPQYEIAFASFSPLNSDIFIADSDGSNPQPFLANPELDYNASFSHDGNWIVFTSQRDGSANIYRAHADGSGMEALVTHAAFDDQAALSPDGNELAFVSSRSGNADIWILNLATKSLRNLTRHAAGDFRPSWSPDGKWIAFSSERDLLYAKMPNDFVQPQSTDIYIVRIDGTGLRRITKSQEFAGSPTWSADGKRLVYYTTTIADGRGIIGVLRRGGTTQIASVDLQSGEVQTLTSGPGEKWSPHWITPERIGFVSGGSAGGVEGIGGSAGARGEFRNPHWSHDGRRMVFQRDVQSLEKNWPPHKKWRTLDPLFRLTRTDVFPSYSPNGMYLASNDRTAGRLQNSVLRMKADGTGRTAIYSSPEKNALAADWSPNSEWMAFSLGQFFQGLTGGNATADIAIMRSDGSELKIITEGKANAAFPSWSGDGRSIVYRESVNGKNALKIAELSTGKSRVLMEGDAHYSFPAWSPTRDLIAFTSDADGDYDVYTINPNGTDLRRLTKSPGNDAHNSWSRDGEWIAFTTARYGFKDESLLHVANPQPYGEIAVMRYDGSDVRVLTDNQFEEGTPAWRSRQ